MKLFNFFKKQIQINTVSFKTVYLRLVKTEDKIGYYQIVSPGVFFKFFNALTGKTEKKVLFSSKEEAVKFCEKLPKNKMVTNLFFCKKDETKPLDINNIEVVVEDFFENRIVIRNFPLTNDVVWSADPEHKTFVLAPL